MMRSRHRHGASTDDILEALLGAYPPLNGDEQRYGLILYRLLSEGLPVSLAAVTEAFKGDGVPAGQILKRSNLRHMVEWGGDDTVIGFAGLTTRHSRHSLLIADRRLSTWCAWDAMVVPGLLGVTAIIESVCPGSGNPVRLRVDAESIERMSDRTPALSFILPDPANQITSADQTILTFCSYVNLFDSRQAGTTWISTRPGTFLLSPADGFELARLFAAARFGQGIEEEPSPPHGLPGSEVA